MTKMSNSTDEADLPRVGGGETRQRNRSATEHDLELAIQRVMARGGRMGITAVAKEAGVTAPLIHNTYPRIADKIRQLSGSETASRRDLLVCELNSAREALRAVQGDLKSAQDDLARLASINESMRDELDLMKAQLRGKVVLLKAMEPPTT